nr:zonular occludens toxin domain-containing protein [Pseudomonas aeruginosa]
MSTITIFVSSRRIIRRSRLNGSSSTNPQEWFKLPPNAIIVIDEAQSFFRVRSAGFQGS